MAHPEEPTLPEDTGQRKNKNINNVLHDISRFLLSEIQRRAFLSPRSVKQYKKVTAMDAKLEQLEATLNNINVFNAGKKREEAVALLAQLLPEVESFQAETQRLRDTIAHERRNASFQREINADLRNELKAERNHSFEQNMKISALEQRCKRVENLISKLPPELIEQIKYSKYNRER